MKRKEAPKIRSNPIKEYQEAIEEDGYAHVVALGSEDCSSSVKHWFSTGSLALDKLLNGKGIPAGRITEIFGPGHIGKSTILDHLLAGCQRAGGVAILADTESARDVRYTTRLGVDTAALQILEFERGRLTIENVLDKIALTADFWATKYPQTPVVIGFDALGGTATSEELEKKLGAEMNARGEEQKQEHTKPGGAAKIMRQACRQLVSKIASTKVAVIFCNHEYENIKMGFAGVGKKRETYGGDAIRLAATYRVELFNLGYVTSEDPQAGRKVGVKLVKNRLGKPWGQTELLMVPGAGVDNTWDIYEHLRAVGVIHTSAGWAAINLDGTVIKFQGWKGLKAKIEEDPTLFGRLVSVYQQFWKVEECDDAGVLVSVPDVQGGVGASAGDGSA